MSNKPSASRPPTHLSHSSSSGNLTRAKAGGGGPSKITPAFSANQLTVQQPPWAPPKPLNSPLNKISTLPSRNENTPGLIIRRVASNSRCCVHGPCYFTLLSDEILLRIFQQLPKKYLNKVMAACRRFRRIGLDETLWRRLDLAQKRLKESDIHMLITRGLKYLRLARSDVEANLLPFASPRNVILYPHHGASGLLYLDLSMTVYASPEFVAGILERCQNLVGLSLENGKLNDRAALGISRNPSLRFLNLPMCQGVTQAGLDDILQACTSLEQLNISWSGTWTEEMIGFLCQHLPPTLLRLNISGYRTQCLDEHMEWLVSSCPKLQELDVSDCSALTVEGLTEICAGLPDLGKLDCSRCYGIIPNSYLSLPANIRALNIHGCVEEAGLKIIKDRLPSALQLNETYFSEVARPTVGLRRTSIWEQRVRDCQ